MSALRSTLCALLLVGAGCYDSHGASALRPGLDGGPRPGADVGPPPWADGSSGVDGGPLPWWDAGPGPDGGPLPTDGGRRDGGAIDAGPPRDGGPRPDAGPPPDAGPASMALRFAPDDRLVVATAPGLDLTSSHTFEMWIRVRADSAGAIAVKGERTMHRFQYGVAYQDGTVVVGWGARGSTHELRAPIELDRWTHVAMVVRAIDPMLLRMTLVVDGLEAADGTFPNALLDAINDQALVFGAGFTGDLDEIRLWRFARTTPGIRASMRTRLSGALPGLQAYWPLEEGGQLALDLTLHGHDAVLGRLTTPDSADPTWIRDGAL